MIDTIFYNKIRSVIPTVCVDLLITNANNEYLLVKRSQAPARGAWWFPGGRILKGETWRNACLRKAKEELGINLFYGELISVEESIFSDEDASVHTVNIVVHMFFEDVQEIILDESHTEFSWQKKVDSNLSDCIKNPLLKFGFKCI
jgi:colanic acid biosynthesis protein WcaH